MWGWNENFIPFCGKNNFDKLLKRFLEKYNN